MAKMLRCTMPHWQGNDLVAAGTVIDPGSGTIVFSPAAGSVGLTVSVIDDYFEPFDTGEPVAPKKRGGSAK